MSLQSGTYIIRSVATGNAVGRAPVEDKTLLPKRVVLLPSEVQGPTWEIEKVDLNGYIMKARGSPTAGVQDSVFAVLLPDMAQPENWRIEAAPRNEENHYIITTQDRSRGWVAPDEPNEQIKCHPLIVGLSEPPYYPPNEVFEIIPA